MLARDGPGDDDEDELASIEPTCEESEESECRSNDGPESEPPPPPPPPPIPPPPPPPPEDPPYNPYVICQQLPMKTLGYLKLWICVSGSCSLNLIFCWFSLTKVDYSSLGWLEPGKPHGSPASFEK